MLHSQRQLSIFIQASFKFKNQLAFRHSCRTRLLKLSIKALSVGFPGLEKSSIMLCVKAQRSSSLEINSCPFTACTSAALAFAHAAKITLIRFDLPAKLITRLLAGDQLTQPLVKPDCRVGLNADQPCRCADSCAKCSISLLCWRDVRRLFLVYMLSILDLFRRS